MDVREFDGCEESRALFKKCDRESESCTLNWFLTESGETEW